jgi:predicted amidohydrolase
VSTFPIALANLCFPSSRAESVAVAEEAIRQAAIKRARLICFPECYIPGYRAPGKQIPPPDPAFLAEAWSRVRAAAARDNIAVILGTERLDNGRLVATALVIDRDGTVLGFQDKVQIDPSEEATYSHGSGRRVFQTGPIKFGVAICHEAWRYPETVRWAAMRGAQIVFHLQFHEAGPGGYVPSTFADPLNTFHEKAMLCRAAENTCYFASVNCASAGSATTSAVVGPEGSLLCYQPYGKEGLLFADVDIALASGLFALRSKYNPHEISPASTTSEKLERVCHRAERA